MIRKFIVFVAALGVTVGTALAAGMSAPPAGTKCIAEYYAEGTKITGTTVMIFESAGLHRWRLENHAAAASPTSNKIVELATYDNLGVSPIETGSFQFANRIWSLRSVAGKHVWYADWINGTLETAVDVSGEFRNMAGKPVLTKNMNCKGNRSFQGVS